jgi:hypothetical protein
MRLLVTIGKDISTAGGKPKQGMRFRDWRGRIKVKDIEADGRQHCGGGGTFCGRRF